MNKNKSIPEWVRWVGFMSTVTILIIFLVFPKEFPLGSAKGIILTIGIALVSAILSLTRRFYSLLIPGIWFIFVGLMVRHENYYDNYWSIYFIIASTLLFLTPIIAFVFRQEIKNTNLINPKDEEDIVL